jgi:hypothetical protein
MREEDLKGKYEVVICAGTLHELLLQNADAETQAANPASKEKREIRDEQAVEADQMAGLSQSVPSADSSPEPSSGDEPRSFFRMFFKAIFDILRPGGVMIVSDFFYPDYLSPDEMEPSQLLQDLATGHADPPVAFRKPAEIIAAAQRSGLTVVRELEIAPGSTLTGDDLLCMVRQRRNDLVLNDSFVSSPSPLKGHHWPSLVAALTLRKYFVAVLRKPTPVEHCAENREFAARVVQDPFGSILSSISRGDLQVAGAVRRLEEQLNAKDTLSTGREEDKSDLWRLFRKALDTKTPYDYFESLARECQNVKEGWRLAYENQSSRYCAFWLSYNSVLLRSANKEFARFMPVGDQGGSESKLYLGRSRKVFSAELSEIAFNRLLVPGRKKVDAEPEGIDVAPGKPQFVGPSIHDWLARVAGHAENANTQRWIKSLTVCCRPDPNSGGAQPNTENILERIHSQADKLAQGGIVAANNSNSCRYIYDLRECQGVFEFGAKLNAFCKTVSRRCNAAPGQGEAEPYCRIPEGLSDDERDVWSRWLEGVASVFLDLVFVARDVPAQQPMDTYIQQVRNSLKGFGDRWLRKPSEVEYLEYGAAPSNSRKCLLPMQYRELIQKAIDDADAFLTCLDRDCGMAPARVVLPRAWTSISLAGPRAAAYSPGTLMLFTDEIGSWQLFDLLALAARRSCELLREVEDRIVEREKAASEAHAADRETRLSAIAGFSHQVSHVIGEPGKSGFSLLRFTGRSVGGEEANDLTLPQVWDHGVGDRSVHPLGVELGARIAQLEYARIVPDIVKDVLDPPSDRNILALRKSPKKLVDEVWAGMVRPLMTIKAGRKGGYNCYLKQIDVKMTGEFPDNIFIPGNHLVAAILFEMLWNAFRWGVWQEQATACPILDGSFMGGADVYVLEVSNPCEADATFESARGLTYMANFASTLRAMMRDPGVAEVSFEILRPEKGVYRVRLALPWTGTRNG